MIYWLHLAGSALAGIIPRRLAYRLVYLVAPLTRPFYRPHYRNAYLNMRRVLGPAAAPREVRCQVGQVFRNYGLYLWDVLRLPRMNLAELQRDVEIRGVEHLDEATASGKGLVLVTGHIGNWDLAGAALAARGYPVNVIVETLEPPRWNEAVQAIRERIGMRAIPLESGPRDMIRALRAKEILGVLIDRPLTEEGVPVRFFGGLTRVPGGAATLALRTGANVITAVVVRSGDRFVAHVDPMLRPEATGDLGRDVETLTQRIMDRLEHWIRSYPDQWFMFRNMWPAAA